MKLAKATLVAALCLLLRLQVTAQPQSSSTNTQTAPPTASPDTGWHLDLSPYLWFAGTHGTVGALGNNVSMRASPTDLLSHFNFGIMGAAEARRHRFLLDGDLMWIRLSQDDALPIAVPGATSADVRVGQFIWTSKVGYRVLDHKGVTADANVGARFWHLGQKFTFRPSNLSLNPSQDWADIVVGGRVRLPVGPKAEIDLLGDVGGWDATAKLDYQFATLLGYKLSPKWTLAAGYRYLFIDYRGGSSSVFNMITSGAIIGATYHFK